MSRPSLPSLRQHRRLTAALAALLMRFGRAVHAEREQIAYGLLTLSVLIVGYLVAIEAAGEPVRSRTVLLLLVAFAFLAGWLHEIHRPGGTYDLHEELAALESAREERAGS